MARARWVLLGFGVLALVVLGLLILPGSRGKPPYELDERDRPAAVLLKAYFDSGKREPLEEAARALGVGPRDGAGSAPSRQSESDFLVSIVSYLMTPENDRLSVFGRTLHEAALRELVANDNLLARRLLDLIWFQAEEDDEENSRDRFARVLFRCSGANRLQLQGDVVAFMGLEPGDVVADVGAGPGFYTFDFARAVGPEGRVLALEINDYTIDYLRRRADELGFTNVTPVRDEQSDIQVAEGTLDHAFMTQLFVDIEVHATWGKSSLFKSILKGLRPGGSFTVCESAKGQSADVTYEWLIEHLEAYGFRYVAIPPATSALVKASLLCVRVARP